MVRLVAADPGTAACGLAVIDTDTVSHEFVRGALFESTEDDAPDDRLIKDTRIARARLLRRWWRTNLIAWTPAVVVVEEFTFLRSPHATACLALANMALISTCDDLRIPVVAVSAEIARRELAGLKGPSRGLSQSEKRKRTAEREKRAHQEATRRIRGAHVIDAAWSRAEQRAHVYDALVLGSWGATSCAFVRGLATR